MVIVAIFQSYGTDKTKIHLSRVAVYMAFLACIAAVFTPTIDDGGRMFAGVMSVFLLVFIALDEKKEP